MVLLVHRVLVQLVLLVPRVLSIVHVYLLLIVLITRINLYCYYRELSIVWRSASKMYWEKSCPYMQVCRELHLVFHRKLVLLHFSVELTLIILYFKFDTRYVPRSNSQQRCVALLPQEEELDENTGEQIAPPGFFIIFLPFSDDMR